jgi:hypothetical protein
LTHNLINPSHFDWGKSFLQYGAWKLIISDKEHEESFLFSLPGKCPVKTPMLCSNPEEETYGFSISPSTPESISSPPTKAISTTDVHLKRKLSKAPLVITEVRRSERIKKQNEGFKLQSCIEKTCL